MITYKSEFGGFTRWGDDDQEAVALFQDGTCWFFQCPKLPKMILQITPQMAKITGQEVGVVKLPRTYGPFESLAEAEATADSILLNYALGICRD